MIGQVISAASCSEIIGHAGGGHRWITVGDGWYVIPWNGFSRYSHTATSRYTAGRIHRLYKGICFPVSILTERRRPSRGPLDTAREQFAANARKTDGFAVSAENGTSNETTG